MSWELPESACLLGETYPHETDFRQILKLLRLLGDESRPEFLRWYGALSLFYRRPIPRQGEAQAMEYLSWFLRAGEPEAPGPRLYDWDQDAQLIAAGVNAAAGREVRSLAYLHWWTFLGYFRSMGQGEFSLVVGIREKLRRGQRLEPQEQAFYGTHRALIRLRSPATPEKQRLEALLRQGSGPDPS